MSRVERDRAILDLELELGVLVRRLKRVIAERAGSIHEDLTPAGYLMLAHMTERGPVRASAMVEAFHLDKGAVSRHVHTLLELGLATKERDPDDGRAWVVSATDAGRRQMDELSSARRERFSRRLEDWSDDELAGFVATLGRYNASLDQQD